MRERERRERKGARGGKTTRERGGGVQGVSERAGPREKGGPSRVRGAKMVHVRERRERMKVRGGKTTRERGRWGLRGLRG